MHNTVVARVLLNVWSDSNLRFWQDDFTGALHSGQEISGVGFLFQEHEIMQSCSEHRYCSPDV